MINQIKKNTVILTASNFLQVLISIITSIGLVRIFEDKAEFGKYQQLFILINFILTFTSGIPFSLNYFYGKYLKLYQRITIYKRFFNGLLLMGIGSVVVSVILRNYLAKDFQNDFFLKYSFAISCLLILKILSSFFTNFNLLTKSINYHFKITLIYLVLTLCVLFLSWKYKWDTGYILWAFVIAEGIRFFFYALKIRFYYKIKSKTFITKTEWKYILPITSIGILSSLYVFTGNFMISSMLSPKEYASYQVGAFVIPFIGIITGSIVTALLPLFSQLYHKGKTDEIISTWKTATKKTTSLLLPILIFSIVFGKEIIMLLYSDKYAESGIIFQIYTMQYLFFVVAFSLTMGAIGLQNWIVLNAVINFIINVILNWVMIQAYGVIGAVYATLITTMCGYILPIFLIKKHLKARLIDYFPVLHYLVVFVMSIILSILFFLGFKVLNLSRVFIIPFSFIYYGLLILIINQYLDPIFNIKQVVAALTKTKKINEF